MKKNVLALSIAAMIGGLGLAGVASAGVVTAATGNTWQIPATGTTGATLTATDATTLRVSDAGVGHNLLVPYFNAQNGNMSVFHVVNTDLVNGKAVKVRFRSASNSDDILDFQVFLSPGDVWTAAVSRGDDGIAQITTADNSCTVPALAANVPQKFVTNRLNAALSDGDKANQTREGYVEIFNMADIPGPENTGGTATALYTAIKHVNNVAPCSVAGSTARTLLNNRAIGSYTDENTAARAGFDTPTSGLLGDWYIINVPQTTTYSGATTSVVALNTAGTAARGNFVHFPQTAGQVAAGAISSFTADPLFRSEALPATTVGDDAAYGTAVGTATVRAANYDLPDMSTPYATPYNATTPSVTAPLDQANLLTSALSVTSVTNQYATDAVITAKTDWVFSMPTRRYSVVANYTATSGSGSSALSGRNSPNYRLFSILADGQTGSPTATPTDLDWFRPNNTSVDTVGNICVNADSQFFKNREEGPDVAGEEPVFSPGTPETQAVFAFCGETSVLAFRDQGDSSLSGGVARQTLTGGLQENGWGVINTVNGETATGAGPGLPILGSAFIKLTNPSVAAGVSGNFGITWPHRFTRVLAPVVAPTP